MGIVAAGFILYRTYEIWLAGNRAKPGVDLGPGWTYENYNRPTFGTGEYKYYPVQNSRYLYDILNQPTGRFASWTPPPTYAWLNTINPAHPANRRWFNIIEYFRYVSVNTEQVIQHGTMRGPLTNSYPPPAVYPPPFVPAPLPPRVPAPFEVPSPYPGFSVPAPMPITRPRWTGVPRPVLPRPIVEVAVDVTVDPPGVRVVPNPRPVRPIGRKAKKESKYRGLPGVASMIFAAYGTIDDAVDLLQVLVDSMDGPKGTPQENARYLSDFDNWTKFDPLKFFWGFSEWLAEEIYYGRVEGAMQDRVNKLLDSPILMRDVFGGQTPDREAPVAAFFDLLKSIVGYEG